MAGQWKLFALERTFVPMGKRICCSCHPTWLPCKTCIKHKTAAEHLTWMMNAKCVFVLFVTASSNLSGLLASDVAKGAIRDHESTGSLTPPRSSSPSLDHRDNEVFSTKVEYEPVRNTNNVSYEPRPSWSSSDSERSGGEKRPSRMSSSHVPAWYKDMQKGVEVPVQKIEEPESYLVQRRPAYGEKSLWC